MSVLRSLQVFSVLFSDKDAFDLAAELLKNKIASKAKAGQIAPKDIEVEAGPTDLLPGPAITELGSVGIQVQIVQGKIHIKENKVIVKEGEKISQQAADVMSKLDIKPFFVGFIPLAAFDASSKKIYSEIEIDPEKVSEELKKAFANALSLALSVGYISSDTIKMMIRTAGAHANKLNRVISGEPEEETAPSENTESESTTKQEDKEKEAAVDPGAGLSALFG